MFIEGEASYIVGLILNRTIDAGILTMNSDAKTFTYSILRVVVPVLFAMAITAFISIPYSLGYHPGETAIPVTASNRHMT